MCLNYNNEQILRVYYLLLYYTAGLKLSSALMCITLNKNFQLIIECLYGSWPEFSTPAGALTCTIFLERMGYFEVCVCTLFEGHLPSLGATSGFFANFAHTFRYTGICKKGRVFAL
jgi:hypothetical protein